MNKKLTLSLDGNIIETAKNYAKSNNISLSKLIESYLGSLTRLEKEQAEITPLVKSLSGIISVENDFDVKDEAPSSIYSGTKLSNGRRVWAFIPPLFIPAKDLRPSPLKTSLNKVKVVLSNRLSLSPGASPLMGSING